MTVWPFLAALVLLAVLIATLPAWPHMRRADLRYGPQVATGALLGALAILLLVGVI